MSLMKRVLLPLLVLLGSCLTFGPGPLVERVAVSGGQIFDFRLWPNPGMSCRARVPGGGVP